MLVMIKEQLPMITFIPRRYTTPKWQAQVTDGEQAFRFTDGTAVKSLFELKQALATLPEDAINHHVNEERHDVADWVEFVIGDAQLAQELRQYTHRWGLIVSLERQLMRTLNLPAYVANRWLSPTERKFTFKGGKSVGSLEELAEALQNLPDEEIEFHCERMPNDIARWVLDVIGDYELAEMLEEGANRSQMHRFITDHLDMLHEAAQTE